MATHPSDPTTAGNGGFGVRRCCGLVLGGWLALLVEGCGVRFGGTRPPEPLPVDPAMMCDGRPVKARPPPPPGRPQVPAKGSAARAILEAYCERSDELRDCYGDTLWRDRNAEGMVTARLVLDRGGRPSNVCFLDTAINDAEALRCIRDVLASVVTPPLAKPTRVVLPVRLVRTTGGGVEENHGPCEELRREREFSDGQTRASNTWP